MKTLADFKRAMVIGSKWSCFNHLYHSDMGVRTCAHVDTVKFGFKSDKGISFCDWPRAADLKIEDGAVNIYGKWGDEVRLKLTYREVV